MTKCITLNGCSFKKLVRLSLIKTSSINILLYFVGFLCVSKGQYHRKSHSVKIKGKLVEDIHRAIVIRDQKVE